jgi:hypothetical protein
MDRLLERHSSITQVHNQSIVSLGDKFQISTAQCTKSLMITLVVSRLLYLGRMRTAGSVEWRAQRQKQVRLRFDQARHGGCASNLPSWD